MPKGAPKTNGDDSVLDSDAKLVQQELTQYLDDRTEKLDFNVTSRLSAARHRALSQKPRHLRFHPHWMRGVSIASVLILVGVLSQTWVTEDLTTADTVTVNAVVAEPQDWIQDMNLLSASDDIEFFESVEFLEWMEQNSG